MRTISTVLTVLALCATAKAETPNELYEQLVGKGVEIRPDEWVTLPQPTMPDGLNETRQQKALLSITDRRHPLDLILRDSVSAKFVLKIESGPKKPNSPRLRTINLWFVTYGDLAVVAEEEFLRDASELAGGGDAGGAKNRTDFLDDNALRARGLPIDPNLPGRREGWLRAEFELLGRVDLGVTRHMVATKSKESLVVASQLDPRFIDDPKIPNRWRSITRDDVGRAVLGKPHPYNGAAFYLKVTPLHEPAGALFIEYHHVFDEPHPWFDGRPLLRSKLPSVIQNGVRDFRRKLDKAMQTQEKVQQNKQKA